MSAPISGSARLALQCCSVLVLCAASAPAAWADFEEVRILRSDPVHFQSCPPPGYGPQAQMQPPPPQGPQPVLGGFTGREIAGGAAGAAVGGLLGNQVGSGSGKTAATVAGAGIGAYAGYKLGQEKPQAPPPGPVGQPVHPGQPLQAGAPMQPGVPTQTAQMPPACTFITHYRISYARPNGMQGEVMMTSQPTSGALMINFCGDRPCQ